MKLFIEPVDVWLFRDGKPFNRGSDHRARSIFPPLPTVMQGVIRTHHIERNGGIPAYLAGQLWEVMQVVGEPGHLPPDTFRLRGPFLARHIRTPGSLHDVDMYFPLPADAYSDGETYRAFELCLPDSDVVTDLEHDMLLSLRQDRESEKQEAVEGGVWLSLQALQEYLARDELPIGRATQGNDLFVRENRFGIGRDDNTRATREGLLYEAEFIRPWQDVGLYVEVEGIGEWDERGILGIGGEGRCGYYQNAEAPQIQHPIAPDAPRFKIVFLTPAYLEQGWQADDWKNLLGTGAVFKGAAVNRPLTLGGFNQATKEQKPARRYVPAGSVYFFEGTPPLHLATITQAGANIGFGQFIIGGW
jgi:CRISPR-associated protein Cmr3